MKRKTTVSINRVEGCESVDAASWNDGENVVDIQHVKATQPELYLPSVKPTNQREIRLPGEEGCTVKRSCEKCKQQPSRTCLRCNGRGYYWLP